MKKLILFACIILNSALSFAGEELSINVKGMVCAFCAQGIEKNFKAQAEVEKVIVSLEKKNVRLFFKDGQRLSNEKITQMLKDAGYESTIEVKK